MNSGADALPDPIREAIRIKRYVQLGVYLSICAIQPPYYLFLGFSVSQLALPFLVGMTIATGAIEGAFWHIFKLRKQSAYPHLIIVRLSTVFDLREACDLALYLAQHYLRAKAAVLAWIDQSGRLVPVTGFGMPEGWRQRWLAPWLEQPSLRSLVGERRAILGRPSECPCWSGLFDDTHVAAHIPLITMERVTAVLSLVGPRRGSDLRDRKLLESIGRVVGLALENLRLNAKQYESIMQVLCSALDMRDRATQGHCQRVAQMARLIAKQMRLSDAEVGKVQQAAALHDIGKIGISDAILSKPGPLTDEEWVEMRRHPELGFHILRDIEGLEGVAEVVHSHHERYDGQGYPRGFGDEAVSLGARIFAVVDTYDAITSDRPYRAARGHREAVDEIVRNSGTQFDPQVVDAFLEVERLGLIRPHDESRRMTPILAESAALLQGN